MVDPQSQPAGARPDLFSDDPPGSAAAEGSTSDIIVFYCPSGHKLNAPARLQGKAGQCPHCGEKFQIPSYEEDQIEEAVEEVDDDDMLPASGSVQQQLAELEEIEEFPETHEELDEIQDEIVDINVEADFDELPLADEVDGVVGPATPRRDHPLGQAFAKLWDQRSEDSSVDLYLAEGELLSPDFFSPQLSQSSHAVFAERVDDGTYNVISVPWETVKKAVITKVDKLPEGLFH
jgi:hypothetical protein